MQLNTYFSKKQLIFVNNLKIVEILEYIYFTQKATKFRFDF